MGELDPLRTGVVGVGSMGSNHARVYHELPGVSLAGVTDLDETRAADVAKRYDTEVMESDDLLAAADAVSIAAPTPHHYDVAREALERDVHVLVEKPFVATPEQGRDLIERAEARDLALQVGHIERFNPAVQTVLDIVPDLDLVAVDARRLGPPVDREISDGVVVDLMIHDLDVLLALVGADVDEVAATGARDGQYVDATIRFADGVVGSLTASRVTQRKVRQLSITARECQIEIDYIAQSVEIHRHSLPEYVEADGDIRYRHERVTEYPTVESGEPLKRELLAFVEAARTGDRPPVDGRAGLDAVRLARRIAAAADASADVMTVSAG